MKSLLLGNIVDYVPFFNAYVDDDRKLVLDEDGDLSMTVDTGFSGGIALPLDVIEDMNLELATFDTFTLATGEIVELPVFLGKVVIKGDEIETWFISGDFLLGMEFLCSVGSSLLLDFRKDTVKLQ
jgi:predicted aspartyl protease